MEVHLAVSVKPPPATWTSTRTSGNPSGAEREARLEDLKFVNYTPIVVIGAMVALWIGWHLSAKKWFTGPKTTIDLPEGVTAADEIEMEHHGKTAHGGKPHDWKPGDPLT